MKTSEDMKTNGRFSGGSCDGSYNKVRVIALICVGVGWCAIAGCKNAGQYRREADSVALEIIAQKQKEALGTTSGFTIERPSDVFRRRLILAQNLPYSDDASLGTGELAKIAHWPEDDYPPKAQPPDANELERLRGPVELSLMQALEIGAYNNFDYQKVKENIFQAALALDLTRNEFRNIFSGRLSGETTSNTTGSEARSGVRGSAEAGVGRTLKSGVSITAAIAADLVKLLTSPRGSSTGIAADASVSIPLLRGSGRHIVTEPLTQAERDVVYAIWDFEQYKREFAVQVAQAYFAVLKRYDALQNSEQNYRSLVRSARRSRRLADAGRLQEIQVDQAVQNELRARQRWIAATESYKQSVDSFKALLGLPPDAEIKLSPTELERLNQYARRFTADSNIAGVENATSVPADARVELVEPSRERAGPLEMEPTKAIEVALSRREDLRSAKGEVYDAQRAVVVAADALGAELTLLGSAGSGGRRNSALNDGSNIRPRFDRASFSGLLTLDLPIERTKERNEYRNSLIELDRATRNLQQLEDQIKLSVRNDLRKLLEAREELYIQAKAVRVAQKRVRSVNLFLEAGRAQMRDLLEAQEALLSAQNSLTSATIDYRLAELELQRDLGVLQVNENGLWTEYNPEESGDAEK